MEQSYKEKYEQAIERLKQWDREHPCAGYVLSDRDKFIFPELKESEDEKVRKEIVRFIQMEVEDEIVGNKWLAWLEKQGQVKESFISQHEIETCKENNNSLTSEDEKVRKALLELVHDTTGDELWIDYNVHKEEALDWLERQGEHANFRNKIQVGDKVTRNEDGVLVNLSQLNRVAKKNEKQGEQKFEMKTAEESLGVDSDTYNKIVDECIFGEQKPKENKGNIGGISPTWSEEDEKNLRRAIRATKVVYPVAADWLKSLQDRVQPKQEWNEEDEQHIDSLLKRLDALCRNKFERTRFAISEDRDWLKSLRPQSQWKPSELQLGCLSDAIEYYNSFGYPAPKLKELLDDLKKLKEGKV